MLFLSETASPDYTLLFKVGSVITKDINPNDQYLSKQMLKSRRIVDLCELLLICDLCSS